MGHDHLIEVNIIVIKGKQIRNLENRPLKKRATALYDAA